MVKRKTMPLGDIEDAVVRHQEKLGAIIDRKRVLQRLVQGNISESDRQSLQREWNQLDRRETGLRALEGIVTQYGFDVDTLPDDFDPTEQNLAVVRRMAMNEARYVIDEAQRQKQEEFQQRYVDSMKYLGYEGDDETDDMAAEAAEQDIRRKMYEAEQAYRETHFGQSPKETDRGMEWMYRGGGKVKANLQNARQRAINAAARGLVLGPEEDTDDTTESS